MEGNIDLSEYEPIDKIGEGGFSEVLLIKHNKTNNIYAAKIALKSIYDISPQAKKDLDREIEITSKLNFPSVLKYYGYNLKNFKDEDKPVIVTEYSINSSLDKLFIKAPLEWNYTKKLINVYGIAAGMEYLYSSGKKIIHRDLKPANILLDIYLYPKICDFGLSKSTLNTLSMTDNYKGTFLYMAPEIFDNYSYSTKSDVYAFSLIAYQILTGEPPFHDKHLFHLMEDVVAGIRPPFDIQDKKGHSKSFNESFKKLIIKCWDQEPENRPSFTEIVNFLETDKGILEGLENEQEYRNYIEYIKKKTEKPNPEPPHFLMYPIKYEKCQEEEPATDDDNDDENTIDDEIDDDEIDLVIGHNGSEEEELNDDDDDDDDKATVRKKTKRITYEGIKICPENIFNSLAYHCKTRIYSAEVKNNLNEQIASGSCFLKGRDEFPLNRDLGIEYLKLAILNGSEPATLIYAQNVKNKKELAKADQFISDHSKSGNPLFGLLKGQILCLRKHYEEAIPFYEDSANKGNAKAAYQLWYIYKYRKGGIPKNDNLAKKYLTIWNTILKNPINYEPKIKRHKHKKHYPKQSKNKNLNDELRPSKEDITLHPIILIQKGLRCKAIGKIAHAIHFFKLAAEKDDIESMKSLYEIYHEGFQSVKINYEKAFNYIKKAADSGDISSMRKTAFMYENEEGVKKDLKEAFKYFKMAADSNDIISMRKIAMMYEKGEGVQENLNEAFNFYRLAADEGDIESMNKFAALCDKKGDQVKACEYYQKAADAGNDFAMFKYALKLIKGEGTDADIDKAISYLQIASSLGNIQADKELKKIKPKRIKLRADKDNDDKAMVQYAKMLLAGNLVEKNEEEAKLYLQKAANLGNKTAKMKLQKLKGK